ncbi:hypothetical protein PENFLA_c040G09832 [Penicillium flavigenum]|uniref:Uncharacterized protein n=1 Tax=Penicillium flavigenum TaxID=254877 RepID=A0A1V6SKN5_9EURO|nr:hypothetical protein PENFLA_c040G09832 [Penicillium flavigenum]
MDYINSDGTLPFLLRILMVSVAGMILVPIFSGLLTGCIMLAGALGLINFGRSSHRKQANTKEIPDLTEKMASLENAGQRVESDLKAQKDLEIEIDSLEEILQVRRDKLACFS